MISPLTFCRREYCIASSKLIALMARFDFELEVHVDTEPRKELPFYLYYGHCKPGSKLF